MVQEAYGLSEELSPEEIEAAIQEKIHAAGLLPPRSAIRAAAAMQLALCG